MLTAPGCGLTLDYTPPDDVIGDAASDVSIGDVGPLRDAGPVDAPALDAPVLDAPVLDAPDGSDVGPVECVVDGDCAAAGPPPCGAWVCNAYVCEVHCADCVDLDLDGYGVGTGCAGGDCDDATDAVGPDASVACYGGPTGTAGAGVCHGGTSTCADGVWGSCVGSVVPTPESCNGADDDCNGVVDDGLGTLSCGLGVCSTSVALCGGGALALCMPAPSLATDDCSPGDGDCDGRVDENCITGCLFVSPTGNDTSVAPSVALTPFRSIQRAIDFAAADATRPQRVCLLASDCATGITVFRGAVTMAQGVSVQGNFGPLGTGRCGATLRTEIQTATPTGVLFPDTITGGATVLADLAITPSLIAGSTTTAGITVDGAVGAVIRNVTVNPGPGVTNGYGVDVHGGGDALITGSTIFAGRGSNEAIGVRVDSARVDIRDNCPSALVGGRCTMGCPFAAGVGIHGRNDTSPSRSMTSYAILLRDAPGSLISTTATCGQMSSRGAGVRIVGDAAGTVIRGSFIAGWGPQLESYGIDLGDCAGASPWIVDNAEINGEGPMMTPSAAIRSVGDCHPVIERNVRILSGLEGGGTTTGVLCSGSSRCVIERNPDIRGAIAGNPMLATGVWCEGDSCARIVANRISGHQGQTIVGLRLGTSDALVDRNHISGGCATTSAVGVLATDSRARFENNVVLGGLPCSAGMTAAAPRFVGLMAVSTGLPHTFDVHGNDFDPTGTATTTCTSRGIELDGTAGAPVGLFRGNIVLAGLCRTAVPFFELAADDDPIALESNDLVPSSPGPVYRDEGATDVLTAALVDLLTDAVVSNNIDSLPGFVSYPANLDLAAGSMCIEQDVAAGPSSHDFDGHARTGVPDIGAYEF